MASLPGVGGIWKDESPASLQTCPLIVRTGRGRQREIGRQASALKTIWRLRNREGKVKRGIWRRKIVSDTGMVRDVWERWAAAELPTRVGCCSYRWDFMVVIRAWWLSWSFGTRGRAFFRQNRQERGEEDGRKRIHMKPQKVEAKGRLGARTWEDNGLFVLMVICRASGRHPSLKPGT